MRVSELLPVWYKAIIISVRSSRWGCHVGAGGRVQLSRYPWHFTQEAAQVTQRNKYGVRTLQCTCKLFWEISASKQWAACSSLLCIIGLTAEGNPGLIRSSCAGESVRSDYHTTVFKVSFKRIYNFPNKANKSTRSPGVIFWGDSFHGDNNIELTRQTGASTREAYSRPLLWLKQHSKFTGFTVPWKSWLSLYLAIPGVGVARRRHPKTVIRPLSGSLITLWPLSSPSSPSSATAAHSCDNSCSTLSALIMQTDRYCTWLSTRCHSRKQTSEDVDNAMRREEDEASG